MPSFLRHERVSSLIQQEFSPILLREVEFEANLVTITRVEVQKDLEFAEIYISVIPNELGAKTVELLQKRRPFLQKVLLKKINIKPMPELRFHLDTGAKQAADIEKLFIEIEKKDENG